MSLDSHDPGPDAGGPVGLVADSPGSVTGVPWDFVSVSPGPFPGGSLADLVVDHPGLVVGEPVVQDGVPDAGFCLHNVPPGGRIYQMMRRV